MNKVAIAFLTKDKPGLSDRTIWPLVAHERGADLYDFDLYWIDGSATEEGRAYAQSTNATVRGMLCSGIRGGPDAAVAYALTTMLQSKSNYTHIGLCESDVLLQPGWFERTMELFKLGARDGLSVGAVSPRAYVDRVLIQRDGYAIMHNLGWGVQIMTRGAARLALNHMRTGHTLENRRTFAHLTGMDIGTFWAFGASENNLCADWGNDKVLASCGLASLALTPSPVEMIGQTPPLAEQGLTIAAGPVEARRNEAAFETFQLRMERAYSGEWGVRTPVPMPESNGVCTLFPHQIGLLGGWYTGDWKLHWHQGLGPFAWKAADGAPTMEVRVSGPCQLLVSGGKDGGQVLVEDTYSGYSNDPMMEPETRQGIIAITVPAGIAYRRIRLTALTPGVIFYGLKTNESQPFEADWTFDHSVLPPVE